MIIRALVDYYESLAKQGKIAKPGWSVAKIAYALNISTQGELLGVFTLLQDAQRGKKIVKVPQNLVMPEGTKRSSGVAAQFLWDNARYVLGIDVEGKEARAKQCFLAMREKTEQVLQNTNGKTASAVKAFFANWNPDTAKENIILKPYIEELMGASNLIFIIEGTYAHEDAEIIAAWNDYRAFQSGEKQAVCMVTGQKAPIARLHPNIKGVRGAQSSGAALVSFNAPSFESYGHEQGMNAAISEYGSHILSSVNKFVNVYHNGNKQLWFSLNVTSDHTVILISKFGKTRHLLNIADTLKQRHIPFIVITTDDTNDLAHKTPYVLYGINHGELDNLKDMIFYISLKYIFDLIYTALFSYDYKQAKEVDDLYAKIYYSENE